MGDYLKSRSFLFDLLFVYNGSNNQVVYLYFLFAAFDQESVISIKSPISNPDGIFIIEGNGIVIDDEEFDSLVILYPTWGDIREVDHKDYGLKAYIGKDHASIVVTKPQFPIFLKDKIKQMWAQDAKPFKPVVNSHKILMNVIEKKGPKAMSKTICYRFKEDIKIKCGPFNIVSDDMQLKTQLRFAPLEIGKIESKAGSKKKEKGFKSLSLRPLASLFGSAISSYCRKSQKQN
jgi:hypothetical protein